MHASAAACARVYEEFIDHAFEREVLASWCADDGGTTPRSLVRLHGRRCAALGGAVHAKGTIAVNDVPGNIRALMARASARAREALGDVDARARDETRVIGDDAVDASDGNDALTRTLARFEANHALINVYDDGCGILPHEDGPLYAPVVCIVSCGASRSMRFEPKRREDDDDASMRDDAECDDADRERVNANQDYGAFEVFLPARSLLVFYGAAYTDFLHGIADRDDEDGEGAPCQQSRGPRVSLTLRRVLNMKKGFEFLTRGNQRRPG